MNIYSYEQQKGMNMIKQWILRSSIVMAVGVMLGACGQHSANVQDTANITETVGTLAVSIEGMQDHYHTGDMVELQAHADEAVASWQWLTGTDDDHLTVVEGKTGDQLAVEAVDGLHIKVRALDDKGAILGESDDVEVDIDDHHGTSVSQGTVMIEGVQDHYHTGDTVTLQSRSAAEVSTWRWLSGVDDDHLTIIEGEVSDRLTLKATDDLHIKVQALDDQGVVIGESDDIEIDIDNHAT